MHTRQAQDSSRSPSASRSGDSNAGDAVNPADQALSRGARLKAAVRDYGSTVIVFHVTISLASLGLFYLLVAR